MSKRVTWVFACDGSNPEHPQGFYCQRCGAHEDVPMPIALDVWLFWAKNFEKRHGGCVAPQQERSDG